jgi:hypothetical protein
MSARKSMTVRFYAHSIAKRAEAIALVDSGVTENFMNLQYAKWLKLPIKHLPEPRQLYNVDGTPNKSGTLRYYTDLEVQTGTRRINMRFFLSDLGEHKAILGYPWFSATQPPIDWKRGWINSSHLPIILQSQDAKKAHFMLRTVNRPKEIHQDQYFIGKVTVGATIAVNPSEIPEDYRHHAKVFSEKESH